MKWGNYLQRKKMRPSLDWKNREEKIIYDQFGHDRELRVFRAGRKRKEVLRNYAFCKECFPGRSLGLVDESYYWEFINDSGNGKQRLRAAAAEG